MRFNTPYPPTSGSNTEEKLDRLISWLYSLTETLNVTMNSISAENLSPDLRKLLNSISERNDSGGK